MQNWLAEMGVSLELDPVYADEARRVVTFPGVEHKKRSQKGAIEPMVVSPSVAEMRAYVLKELREDLVGPHEELEYLGDRPTAEYLAGILYPTNMPLAEEEENGRAERALLSALEDEEQGSMQGLEEGGEARGAGGSPEGEEEGGMPGQASNPTSQGLSCAIADGVKRLQVEVAYGVYTKCGSQQAGGWQRTGYKKSVSLELDRPAGWRELEHGGWIYWTWRIRHRQRCVTICLVNRQRLPDPQEEQEMDEFCLFQSALRVTSADETYPFVPLVSANSLPDGPDLPVYEFFYRNCPAFAIGHGCAANWGSVQEQRTHEVRVEQVPSYELEETVAVGISGLSMLALGKARGPAEVVGLVQPLLEAYEQWIEAQSQKIVTLPEDGPETGETRLRQCKEALERMKAGLALIQQDGQVFEAFRFANQAMLYQLSHRRWAHLFRQTGTRPQAPSWEGTWQPFQLAFLLLSLPGIVDPESAERDLVDVLWLPAGNGKLEAYLGLIAFTLGLRRLRGQRGGQEGDGGVTVMMRYTLCLLATQHFQQAASLICACEYLRRRDPQQRWGRRPFQIGLWVGEDVTPRHLKKAEEVLKRLSRGEKVLLENPCRLACCPWCGEPLTNDSYIIYRTLGAQGRVRLLVVCPRPACAFSLTEADLQQGRVEKSLPVVLVDEDVYHQCPSLLVTAVDCCARLPWEPETMALFGRVNRFCPDHGYLYQTEDHSARHRGRNGVLPCAPLLPPELIIQDGLHLLTGTRGTLAGLYESAIEQLCTSGGQQGRASRPKVLASTATLSWINERVKSLFAREGQIFPPLGLCIEDAFFAVTRPLTLQAGRLYVGVSAPGRSVQTALVRVYALLLQIAGEQSARCGPGVADAYTTLLGHFNSLAALQGALRLVEDEVVQRMHLLAERRGRAALKLQSGNHERIGQFSSQQNTQIRNSLAQPGGDQQALDLLLLTKMSPAGIHISRPDLLVVYGLPETGAQYLQATSQIGRRKEAPGLVVTVFNWPRRRDRWHYECFRSYHQALLWHMERPGLTPFASGARDCALHAVLIAVARLLQEQWAANICASHFDAAHELVAKIRDEILARVRRIDPAREDEVRQHLLALLHWWQRMATEHGEALRYQKRAYQDGRHLPVLLHHAGERHIEESLPTLHSLRDVNREACLFLSCREEVG